MLPWNIFITAESFWQYKLRNTSNSEWDSPSAPLTPLQVAFTPTLVIVSNVFCFSFLFVNSIILNKVTEKQRILGSIFASLAAMALITSLSIVDTDSSGEAIFQGSLFGLVGQLPSPCTTAVISGQAFAGIVSSVARIISLAAGDDDAVKSAIIYFAIADAALFGSLWCYIYLIKSVWPMGFTLGFVFVVTLSIFPAVLVYVDSTAAAGAWADVYFQPVVTFLLFNIGDMLGREAIRWLQWPKSEGILFHLLSACRVVFIPLFLLCNGENKTFPTIFYSDTIYVALVALFAFSNGYFGALPMIYYPRFVEDEELELAGTLLAVMMGVGLVLGSVLSPAFVMVWGPTIAE